MTIQNFMKKEEKIYLTSLLLMLLIFCPLTLFGQEANPQKTNKVEIKDNLITADLKEADLPEVLKEIEKATGVRISVVKELEGKKVTSSFKNLDAESVLRKLLGNNYVFVFSKEKDKYVLKEVMTAGADFGSRLSKGKMITIEIGYGKGKEEVWAFNAGEGAFAGPPTFTVDDKGNIYIPDPDNGRIQIFSSDGKYVSSIPFDKGRGAHDIVIDHNGFLYTFANFDGPINNLYQYDKNGNTVAAIEIDSMRRGWGNIELGQMQLIDNKFHIYACENIDKCGYYLIGKTDEGRLMSPSHDELKKPVGKGTLGTSGKRYLFGVKDHEEGIVDVIYADSTAKKYSFPVKEGTLLTQFIGEDKKGNIYLESMRPEDKNGTIVYSIEIHKLTADGNYESSIQMPAG